jgi:YD repeat-containing protein
MRSKILLLLCYALLTASALADSNSPNEPDDKNLRTIQPHTRSAAVNAKHAQECAEMGGVDVSDDSEMQISSNNLDALACKITDTDKYTTYLKANDKHLYHEVNGKKVEIDVAKLLTMISNSDGIDAIAPSGTYWKAPFTYEGAGIFPNFTYQGDVKVEVNSFVAIVKTSGGLVIVRVENKNYPKAESVVTSTSACIWNSQKGHCNNTGVIRYGKAYFPGVAPSPPKNEGMPDNPPSCNMPSSFIADPINIAVGNSFQHEVDISGSGAYPLAFIRYYNSVDGIWRHNYSSSVKSSKLYPDTLELTLADGRVVYFFEDNGVITASATELGTLKRIGTGYQYTSPFHEVLDFDDDGYLTRMTSNGGIVRTLSRHTNKVFVTDNLGYALWITEDAKHQPVAVTSKFKNITDDTVEYKYDNEDRLIKVTIDGASREYHYEDTRFPRALTSITNENGVRYATWTYDDKGRANSNMHAGNKDKVSITYNSDSQTTFTNPLGRKYTYNYTVIDGLKRITSISGAASSLCPAIGSSYQYNAKGLVIAATDGRGIKTTYEYNDAGQETSRTIASGTSSAVTITTTWDDRFNLPKTETYPDKVITYSYDADGSLVEQTVKSTS